VHATAGFTVLNTNELACCFAVFQSTIRFLLAAGAMTMPALPDSAWKMATEKVRAVEDSWNSREPIRVALCYTIDSFWRSRTEFLSGRSAIEAFLTRKWLNLTAYRRINELWAVTDNRIAVRFACEYQEENGDWYRDYGNENWELDIDGLIRRRLASINRHSIFDGGRILLWPAGRRPDDYPELSDFDL
jgi:nuclear transport factor 2 (NTF2) superfamily protein